MRTKPLGRTGIQVTELCLGSMTWGLQNTEAEGHAQMDRALDAGINFIDTAEIYAVPPSPQTYGRTETIIGNWFGERRQRDKWVLATKISSQTWIRGGARPSAATIRTALEDSLRRLRTDYVDLYQIHVPARGHFHFDRSWEFHPEKQDRDDVAANMAEVLATLDGLVREGKIRALGLSNESAWGIAQYLKLSDTMELSRFASVQNEYNLLRRHFDLDLAELCHHENIGLLAYSPLASGVLTGKYLDGAVPPGSRGDVQKGMWRQNQYSDAPIRDYLALAREHDLDAAQMAIAFCLSRPFMTSVIIGATTLDQLETAIGAAGVTLPEAVLGGIDAIHRRYPRPI